MALACIALLAGCKQPDLTPANPTNMAGFCNTDEQNRLIVYVKNQGEAAAPISTVKVEFFCTGSSVVTSATVPALKPGQTTQVLITPALPPCCWNPDCDFKITVDVSGTVDESDEGNNTVSGTCVG